MQLTAQNETESFQLIFNDLAQQEGYSEADLAEFSVSNVVPSKSGVVYTFLQQEYNGVPIHNALINVSDNGSGPVLRGNRAIKNLQSRITVTNASMEAMDAFNRTLDFLHISLDHSANVQIENSSKPGMLEIFLPELSKDKIFLEKKYFPLLQSDDIPLVWEVMIYPKGSEIWWILRFDANTGQLVDHDDLFVRCDFGAPHVHNHGQQAHQHSPVANAAQPQPLLPAQYNVFALPVESPNHGSRSIVVDPSDSLASPYGWHDDNGVAGAEYTITRGNNVHAYEDVNNNDGNPPGFSPDGTSALDFDFPYSNTGTVAANQDAAITNLFYMNNMMHDVWYHYGFDEAAGNFQENNYGRGGTPGDYVQAEAQDGGGTNNANFATPPDGSRPTMQMFLWGNATSGGATVTVNSPTGIAGSYAATTASFGPAIGTPITEDVVLAIDNTAPVNDACDPITNGAALAGKIAILDRGNCTFVTKVQEAQFAGAIAVIVVNNVPGAPITLGGNNGSITIPSVMVSQADGNLIKNELANGPVNVTLGASSVVTPDGDFDNGIIAHEYGHGISIRMTGGAFNSGCLSNAEQMGEGWSDWFGLMLTIEPGDQGGDIRGIGTYAVQEPTTGPGIRPAPYSTNFNINPYTYGNSNDANISVPHGVGFIYATVLWDLTWALINQYGGTPDTDLINGTGGNNIAMALVTEAFNNLVCNPGMVDGRDAILAADQALYGGIHECLIWDTFANRGLGFSASQGSSQSRNDQVEAFDLPPICMTPTSPPNAAFTANQIVCDFQFNFTDNSTDIPQSWMWDFGDGNTSTLQNPSHVYAQGGTYTVKLIVSNTLGADSITQTVSIVLPAAPSINTFDACVGNTATITASASGEVVWSDINGNSLGTGDTLTLPGITGSQTVIYQNDITGPAQFIGPPDNTIGPGGYHGTGFHGALNFTAQQACTIVSAWVDAEGQGLRSFIVASGSGSGGTPTGAAIVDQVTVMLQDGPQRITLNLEVPGPGNYHIGATPGANDRLYRNSSGANYPYSINGLVDITSSSANTDPTSYYYYLYDWEVQEATCLSEPDTLVVTPSDADFSYTNNINTVTFTDLSSNATDWLWDFGDGTSSNVQNPVHTYVPGGNFNVTLTVNSGACSISQFIDVPLSTLEEAIVQNLVLVPNPSSTTTRLDLQTEYPETAEVKIYSSNGQLVWEKSLEKGSTGVTIPTDAWAQGVYLVNFQSASAQRVLRLLVE